MSGGVIAYIDGGARGNPGPAGFGVRIENPDGTLVEEFHESIGTATNNVAEYRGLLAALEWAKARGRQALHVRSDSLLLVQQMRGVYKVKSEGLVPLNAKARLLAHEIGKVTYEHVRREANAHADRLANAAMDGVPTPAAARQVAADTPQGPVESVAFAAVAASLLDAVTRAIPALRAIPDEQARRPVAAGKWCRKEILGHLIDSAANNHHRFVRAQAGSPLVFPDYDQARWVRAQQYAERDWNELLALWERYNQHLAHVIARIPEATQSVECRIGADPPVTLGFLAQDYVAHLRHHLAQL